MQATSRTTFFGWFRLFLRRDSGEDPANVASQSGSSQTSGYDITSLVFTVEKPRYSCSFCRHRLPFVGHSFKRVLGIKFVSQRDCEQIFSMARSVVASLHCNYERECHFGSMIKLPLYVYVTSPFGNLTARQKVLFSSHEKARKDTKNHSFHGSCFAFFVIFCVVSWLEKISRLLA